MKAFGGMMPVKMLSGKECNLWAQNTCQACASTPSSIIFLLTQFSLLILMERFNNKQDIDLFYI